MPRLALLIDGENVGARHFPEIARHCLKLGDLRIAQVFADFSDGKREGWLEVGRQFGVQPMFQLSGGKGKNSTDIAMTIAAMDVMHAGAIDTICLVSSDRDFIPLAQRLRRSNLRVIGIGLDSADRALAECCDQFFLLPPKAKAPSTPEAPKSPLSADERAFMIDLIADICRTVGKPSVAPGLIGYELKKRNPQLAARLGGQKLLKRLLASKAVVEHGTGTTKTVSAVKVA